MNKIKVVLTVNQEHLIPLMSKLGVEEWSFKKDHVDVDLTMTKLFDQAMSEVNNQDIV